MTFVPPLPVPYIGANRAVDLGAQNLTSTGLATFGNLDVDTLNLNANVITDSTGTISFNDDHLQTTGNIYNKADNSKHYFGASDDVYCEFSSSSSAWDFYPGAKSLNINRGSFDASTLENVAYGLRIGHRKTTNATVAGAWAAGQYDGTVTNSNTVYGFNAFAYITNSGDLTRTALPGAVGNFMEVQHQSTGTISLAAGALLRGKMTAAGTITRYADLKVMEFDRDAGTITTLVGLDIDALTEGGTNWGIYDAGNQWLISNKLCFTQTDGDEYIDSANDGYMDYGATTAHRFDADIITTGMVRIADTWHTYGGFEGQAETIACGAGDWNHITNGGNDLWNLDENTGITIASDVLDIANAGDYMGGLSLSLSGLTGKDFHVRVYNNTQTRVEGRPIGISTTGAGNEMNVSVPIYIVAVAGDDIQFEISSADGTDPVVDDALFWLSYLHD